MLEKQEEINNVLYITESLEECERENIYRINLDSVTLNVIHRALLNYLEDLLDD